MDCFRSGRDCAGWVAPAPTPGVLAGRGGAEDSPRKSRPRSESFVDVFGGAGAALLAGWPFEARGGAESEPPMRSISGGARDRPMDAWRVCSFFSMDCFSLTMLRGTSSSPSASRLAGSGMGPSMTHLFSSYFVRIKFSIFASDGAWPAASLDSQYLFARALPQLRML